MSEDKVRRRKEYLREYRREWARRKRAGLPTKGIRPRPTDHLTPEEMKERKKEQRKEQYRRYKLRYRDMIKKYLGTKCVFCGSKKRLIAHRKDGIKHPTFDTLKLKDVENELSSNEYVRVCYGCHKGVHWSMEFLELNWNDIKPV